MMVDTVRSFIKTLLSSIHKFLTTWSNVHYFWVASFTFHNGREKITHTLRRFSNSQSGQFYFSTQRFSTSNRASLIFRLHLLIFSEITFFHNPDDSLICTGRDKERERCRNKQMKYLHTSQHRNTATQYAPRQFGMCVLYGSIRFWYPTKEQ